MSTVALAPPNEAETWYFLEDEPSAQEVDRQSPLALLAPQTSGDRLDLKGLFDVLADELADASMLLASPRKAARHPAYAEILALGSDAVPLLLSRVAEGRYRPLWLQLLGSLTNFPPGAGQDTIDAAAQEWTAWARREGRLVGGY